ncbi:alpha/beta hydrolase [Faunimonas pinastri]|nr:alpha/beta hydrolase [Faunimonas pinastri]
MMLKAIGRNLDPDLLSDIPRLRDLANRQMTPRWFSRLQVRSVRATTVPGADGPLPARIYRPRTSRPLGVIVYFHGGGFVHCGLDSHDNICCRLARISRSVVVSVDYRLAPEHPFPAAPDDAYAATVWVAEHAAELAGEGAPIGVAGDSAGGNLAAVVSQMARDRGGPEIAFQLLYYPTTHGLADVPSRRENAEGYLLTGEIMQWYLDRYVPDEKDRRDPRFAPFLAESLAGLPPALVVVAGYDPLRDEGIEYGERMRRAGVAVRLARFPATFHGFVNFYPVIPAGRQAISQGAIAVRKAFLRR